MITTEGIEYEDHVLVMYALVANGKVQVTGSKWEQAHLYSSKKDAEFMKSAAKALHNLDCQVEQVVVLRQVRNNT